MNTEPLKVEWDQSRDILTVNGFQFSGSVFRELIYGSLFNPPFVITKREDGVITCETHRCQR